MTTQPVLQRLPPLVQNERNREKLSVTFDADTDVYDLPKGPVLTVHEVTGVSGGTETTFTEGFDYTLSTTSEGYYDAIDWGIGGDSPDDGTEFTVDQSFKTIINRYTLAHDEEFEKFGDMVAETIDAHEIDNATGDDLDRLGAIFGTLGKRRGRDDQDYRIYLKSVVQSFNGRGSLQGLRFAIASAIGTDSDNIEIVERFSDLEYDVQIFNVNTPFISSAINDLAELADPSVVELGEAIIVFDAGGILVRGGGSEVIYNDVGLGGGTLTLDGNSRLAGATVDNFEDQSLSEYSGDTAGFSVTSTQVKSGTYSLEVTAGTNPSIVSTSGLDNYPSDSNTLAVDVYVPSGSTARPQVQWYAQDANNSYVFEFAPADGSMTTYTQSGGTLNQETTVSSPDLKLDTWYRIEVRLINTEFDITVFEIGNSVPVDTISFSDTTYSSGGIGFREGNGTTPCYWDNMRLI